MAVSSVKLEGDALMVCLTHALSTEREEVMGLMIGEAEDGIAHVYSVIMLQRLDKRKDRVEISPEQLSDASTQAERLGLLTPKKRPMRVVGWYHSHPHITVWPSHVDLATQAMYQVMDEGFVGVIFSCFNDEPNHTGSLTITCFQSVDCNKNNGPPQYKRAEVDMEIVQCSSFSEANLQTLIGLPEILAKEEEEAFNKVKNSVDVITSVYNETVFTKAICQLTEVICGPLMQALENRLELNKRRAQLLKDKLRKELMEPQAQEIL
ncbi:lys-63-specific deubiquitinase BRCC36 [Nematostella vectensis]|uniref:lys-63-specific deubiquitinase BRCC36 n=1 Tax=Nematostella vectensis TaxID=45351 RepID=UPI00207787A5|nr:lys-63-specific deubiquitinase BRCC36 [Nematostella vectensis]